MPPDTAPPPPDSSAELDTTPSSDAPWIDAVPADAPPPDAMWPCMEAPGCDVFTCGTKCIMHCPGATNWFDAQMACHEWSGELATISTSARNGCIYSNTPNFGTGWIGLTQDTGATEPDGGWRWTGTGGLDVYTNWAGGEPNNAGGGEGCAEFRYDTAEWNDQPCSVGNEYLCER